MDFALSEIDTKAGADAGAELQLLRLDASPLLNKKKEPITLTLLGSDSSLYRRLNRELGRARLARMQKSRTTATTDEELDRIEKEDIDLLARITTGWSGILDTKDKPIPFSLENAVDLYTKFPVAREQAERFVVDRGRFIQPS
jgi:hypothetical protein